jgi:transcriptional regulator GlxA family with amidase domain
MRTVGFMLLPAFPLIPFAAGVELLRLTNRELKSEYYRWQLISLDGEPVSTSSGIEITPDVSLSDAKALDLIVVVGGEGVEHYRERATFKHLLRLAKEGVAIGAVTLGSFVLARAGLLEGYRCTVHWEYLESFQESFPHLDVQKEVYEIDRDRLTCSGGTAALDMMLAYIGEEHGGRLAQVVSELVLHDRIRAADEPQRMPLTVRLGVSHPKLVRVVEMMERNIDTVTPPYQLAHEVGLSGRQLERLFRKYLGTTPKRYHLQARLNRARQLLRQTTLSVLDVAVACGFSTASHFTKSYRGRFNITPRGERSGIN